MRLSIFALGLVVALLLISTPARAQGITTGAIAGTVTDSVSGEKLAGVSVSVGGQTAITDGDGKYEITGLPPATYAVEFELASAGRARAGGGGRGGAGARRGRAGKM